MIQREPLVRLLKKNWHCLASFEKNNEHVEHVVVMLKSSLATEKREPSLN